MLTVTTEPHGSAIVANKILSVKFLGPSLRYLVNPESSLPISTVRYDVIAETAIRAINAVAVCYPGNQA